SLPERVTADDLRDAADQARKAAADVTDLLKAQLPGCICRRIQDGDRDYLIYEESCRHHRDLCLHRERLKADYAKMEKRLKAEVRMKLVTAALSGAAVLPETDSPENDDIATRTLAIADQTIDRLTRDV